MTKPEPTRYVIDHENLPESFPTHHHTGEFWEVWGRAVATYGFLEEILANVATNKEIASGEVVVSPLLYEECELPEFLKGSSTPTFRSPNYEAVLSKFLRRLRIA